MTERTPLLPTTTGSTSRARRPSPTSTSPAFHHAHHHHHPTSDDLSIEGFVLSFLQELHTRGLVIPNDLIELPNDMNEEELGEERKLYEVVWRKQGKVQGILEGSLPTCANTGGTTSNGTAVGMVQGSTEHGLIDHPTSLFLCGLLSLLITLQAEPNPSHPHTHASGVETELKLFKQRRDLGIKLYAIVGGLLDSYLLDGDGDGAEEEGGDKLVMLLFKDYPLNYDSIDRATCALDLLLNLSSYPLVEAEELISHPVVLAASEYVWRNGLLPPPPSAPSTPSTEHWWTSWRSWFDIDQFSVPRILHLQTYLFSTLHAFITLYILLFSAYAHFDSLNPLLPDKPIFKIPEIPEHGRRPEKANSFWAELIWWVWCAGVVGWAGEVGRAWHHRGPHPSLPLSPSTLLPLVHHALVLASLLLRFPLLFFRQPSSIVLSSSLSVLAWSIPFLAASRILPQNLPAFGSPTHAKFESRDRKEVGYKAPPKSVPESHRALRSLESQLGGLVQFGTYFVVVGILLLWSLSGELDYPGLVSYSFQFPARFFKEKNEMGTTGVVSPIEARTTLAFTLILGVVLAYFAGGRPSVSGKPPRNQSTQGLGLDDLDGWDRYGREVAFRSRRERLAIIRYFTFLPPSISPFSPSSTSSVPSAFSTPPLPSPLNLFIPTLLLASGVANLVGKNEVGRKINERGRLWIWRGGLWPLSVWEGAKSGIGRIMSSGAERE